MRAWFEEKYGILPRRILTGAGWRNEKQVCNPFSSSYSDSAGSSDYAISTSHMALGCGKNSKILRKSAVDRLRD